MTHKHKLQNTLILFTISLTAVGCLSTQKTLTAQKDWPEAFKSQIAYANEEVILLDEKAFKDFTTTYLKPTMRLASWEAYNKRFAADKTRHLAYIVYTEKPMSRGFNYWQFGPVATNKQTGAVRDLYLNVRRWQTTIDGKEAHIHLLRLNQNYEAKPNEVLSLLVRNSARGLDKTFSLE